MGEIQAISGQSPESPAATAPNVDADGRGGGRARRRADPRRNKLEHEKANKLVALFHNLRLLSRMAKPAYSEPAIGWNQEDDAAGVVKYGVANYEPARKSAAALVRPPQPALCLAPVRPPLDHDEMPLLM